MAFSFQIPTSRAEAVLTATLYLSVKGALSAFMLVLDSEGRKKNQKTIGEQQLFAASRIAFYGMDLPRQALLPPVAIAGKVSMLTLGWSFLWVPLGGEAKVLLKSVFL